MRITYYPEHDALEILLKENAAGPGYAEDVSPDGNVTAHFTGTGELISFEGGLGRRPEAVRPGLHLRVQRLRRWRRGIGLTPTAPGTTKSKLVQSSPDLVEEGLIPVPYLTLSGVYEVL